MTNFTYFRCRLNIDCSSQVYRTYDEPTGSYQPNALTISPRGLLSPNSSMDLCYENPGDSHVQSVTKGLLFSLIIYFPFSQCIDTIYQHIQYYGRHNCSITHFFLSLNVF